MLPKVHLTLTAPAATKKILGLPAAIRSSRTDLNWTYLAGAEGGQHSAGLLNINLTQPEDHGLEPATRARRELRLGDGVKVHGIELGDPPRLSVERVQRVAPGAWNGRGARRGGRGSVLSLPTNTLAGHDLCYYTLVLHPSTTP